MEKDDTLRIRKVLVDLVRVALGDRDGYSDPPLLDIGLHGPHRRPWECDRTNNR